MTPWIKEMTLFIVPLGFVVSLTLFVLWQGNRRLRAALEDQKAAFEQQLDAIRMDRGDLFFYKAPPPTSPESSSEAAENSAVQQADSHFLYMLKQAFVQLPLGAWFKDMKGRVVLQSAEARQTGIALRPSIAAAHQRALGRRHLISNEFLQGDENFMKKDGSQEGAIERRKRVFTALMPDEEEGWRLVRETPLEDPANGTLWGTVGISLALEQAWHLSQVLSGLSLGVVVCTADRRAFVHNEAFLKLSRLESTWLDRRPLWENVLERMRFLRRLPEPEDWAGFKKNHIALFTGANHATLSQEHVLSDGAHISLNAHRLQNGIVAFIWEDQTVLRQTQTQLALEKMLFEESLDYFQQGALVVGANGSLRRINKNFATLWHLESLKAPAASFEKLVEEMAARLAADSEENLSGIFLRRTRQDFVLKTLWGAVLHVQVIPLPHHQNLVLFAAAEKIPLS